MISGGYIKLHRKWIESPGLRGKTLHIALWVALLSLATHSARREWFGGKEIQLKPGEFITGRKYLSEITGLSQTSVERILRTFEIGHQIGQQKSNKNRLISIIKWAEYQKEDSTSDNRRTTDGHIQ